VQAYQEACPSDQNITTIAIDANGDIIASIKGVNWTGFTILEDAAYPVTVIASANVGNFRTVISNVSPIRYAIGNSDNCMFAWVFHADLMLIEDFEAPTQTVGYDLEIDFCPPSDEWDDARHCHYSMWPSASF
jgi:hypothetical protein